MNSSEAIDPKSSQYGKNRIEEHKDASQIDQKAKEKSPHSLNDSLKALQGSNGHRHEDHAAFVDKNKFKDHCMEKLQSDFISEQPLTVFKHDSNISKERNRLSYYGNHHLGNLTLVSADKSSSSICLSKQSSSIVYPPPPNQWLVPVMSPSEGLVYKPIIGPCPPNAGGIMTPLYGACGALSLNPGTKDVLDPSLTSFHQKIGILSGSSLPQLLPPFILGRSDANIERNKSMRAELLKLTVEQVEELKKKANEFDIPKGPVHTKTCLAVNQSRRRIHGSAASRIADIFGDIAAAYH
ncbi:hypothetical protein KIW84_021883 [Lathyrus oleraceus]|uniref:Uncharacterized protein n=1 Tax=Pisum sativum TaxID=3888 RepID=A0A9D5BAG9_PEA|nr:hypothetical protein KIW84_021883 [Pisum sativum]